MYLTEGSGISEVGLPDVFSASPKTEENICERRNDVIQEMRSQAYDMFKFSFITTE